MSDHEKLVEALEQMASVLPHQMAGVLPLARQLIEEVEVLRGELSLLGPGGLLSLREENERLKGIQAHLEDPWIRLRQTESRLSAAENRATAWKENCDTFAEEQEQLLQDAEIGRAELKHAREENERLKSALKRAAQNLQQEDWDRIAEENERLKADYGIRAIQERDADIETLQARLSAAENEIDHRKRETGALRSQLQRADEVVEAAKSRKHYSDSPQSTLHSWNDHEDLDEVGGTCEECHAIRRYEGGA